MTNIVISLLLGIFFALSMENLCFYNDTEIGQEKPKVT